MKKIYIVMLTFGHLHMTEDCIGALQKKEKNYKRIILINNDNTIHLSSKNLPFEKLKVINNKENLGFPKAANIGISYALKNGADAVLLLNNDVIIKEPFLKRLLNDLIKHKDIGIIGPAIGFERNGRKLFDVGGKINFWTGRTSHTVTNNLEGDLKYVDYITGAVMLIKKEVFAKVGLLEDKYFLYYDDSDFCTRAKISGFKTAVDTTISEYHLLSKTIGKLNSFAIYHQTRSIMLFGKKFIKSPFKKIIHLLFVVAQTLKVTLNNPKVGLAGWKAIYDTIKV